MSTATNVAALKRLLKGYKPKGYPTIEGGVPNYTKDELQSISTLFEVIKNTLLDHEARISDLEGG